MGVTVSGNGDRFGFGFTACRRSVPGLQRLVDHLETAFHELEAALLPGVSRPRKSGARAGEVKARTASPSKGRALARRC
jgi:diacylglycerol O-acyltransferase